MAHGKEKRSEKRVPVDLWIEAERPGELYYQRASNLSVGGAYFAQTMPLPLGSQVTLKFTLPGDTHEISCDGNVVTTKEDGMGVHFEGLRDDDKQRIETLVSKLASQRPAGSQ